MKKLNGVVGIASVLVLTLFVLFSFTSRSNQEPGKQVMLVEADMSMGRCKLYIFHNDKATEEYTLKEFGPRNTEVNARLISGKLQELYDQGWRVEGIIGDGAYHRYLLAR